MFQHGYLMHCMNGWRAAICVLDNLTPHAKVYNDPDDPDYFETVARRGFGWACELHRWAGGFGKYGRAD